MSQLPSRMIHQPGLQWDDEGFPAWSEEPAIDTMKKLVQQQLDLEAEPEISFFAEGALKKLYAFDCQKSRFLIRVTLPVAPSAKTDSEIATIAFIRKHTNIPVPKIIAHNPDLRNNLGFEWIIMERIEAQPLHEMWHQLSWLKKQLLVQQIAALWAELFEVHFSRIGSLHTCRMHPSEHDKACREPVHMGEIVLPKFFMDGCYQLDIDRGPYNSSRKYLDVCLDIVLYDATKFLTSSDEDKIEHGKVMRNVYSGLKTIIPRYFSHSSQHEQTLLHHRDLTAMNILVNED